MRFAVSLVLVCCLQVLPAGAQAPEFTASANPVSDAVRAVLVRESKNLVASAELLPAEKYGYQPTPAQMTFGQLMAHIVQTNMLICSAISTVQPPMGPPELAKVTETVGKDALVAFVRQSFDYCTASFAKVTDAQLSEQAVAFGRPVGMSRAAAMITIATDWADHYSTAASSLRMNGILPPSAAPAK